MNFVKKFSLSVKLFAAVLLAVPATHILADAFDPSVKAVTNNAVALDGMLDGDYMVELLGVDTQSATNLKTLNDEGFASLAVAKLAKADGQSAFAVDIAPSDLKADGAEIFSTTDPDPALLPGKVVKLSSSYYVFASNIADANNDSLMFATKLNETTGAIDATFNSAADSGTLQLKSSKTGEYDLNADAGDPGVAGVDYAATPRYVINDVKAFDDQFAIVVGSLLDDDNASFKRAFIGVANMNDVDDDGWMMNPVAMNNAEFLAVDISVDDITGAGVAYVAGYNNAGALVAKYAFDTDKNGTTAYASPVQIALDTAWATSGILSLGADRQAQAISFMESEANLAVALAEQVQVDPVLKEKLTVAKVVIGDAAVDATFGDSGYKTYFFDPNPQMSPLSFDPAHPEYEFSHKRLSMQIGANDEIFVAGTLTNQGLPFVYKLNADGTEANYARNFKHIVNKNDELVQALVDSPVMYPVVGQSWMGSVHGVYASAIDTANNWVYLFGARGTVDRNVDVEDPTVAQLAIQDVARRVTTGNLTITGDVNNIKMNAMYSEQEIQVQVMDGSSESSANVTGNSSDVEFTNFRVYSNPARYQTVGGKNLELYGTVTVSLTNRGAAAPDVTNEVVPLIAEDLGEGLDNNTLGINIGKLDMSKSPSNVDFDDYATTKDLLEAAGLTFHADTDSVALKNDENAEITFTGELTFTQAMELVNDIDAIEFLDDEEADNSANETTNTVTLVKSQLEQFIRSLVGTVGLAGYPDNKTLLEVAGLTLHEDTASVVFKDGEGVEASVVNVLQEESLNNLLALVDTIAAVEFLDNADPAQSNESETKTLGEVKVALKQFIRGYANLRLQDSDGAVCDETYAPTVANGAISQGKLVGTMSDGTVVELTVKSLELVDSEVISIASEVQGQLPLRLINNYDHESHTISIDNDFLVGQEITILDGAEHSNEDNDGGAAHTSTATIGDVKLDVIEAASSDNSLAIENLTIFGYIEVESSEFGSAVFPVHGALQVNVSGHKLQENNTAIVEGDISSLDNPTGSYIQGRTQFGRLSLSLHDAAIVDLDGVLDESEQTNPDAVMHREIRAAATVQADAILQVGATGSNGQYTITWTLPGATTTNPTTGFTVSGLELTEGETSRVVTGTGQHKVRITGTADVTWNDVAETLQDVPVGGDLIVTIDSNGQILESRLDNFVMNGKATENANTITADSGHLSDASVNENHGMTTLNLRIHPTGQPVA